MSKASIQYDRTVFTIGHSNHNEQAFLELLAQHGIEVVADVRSQPYSKYTSQFNAGQIQRALAAAGVKYVYLGKELGGRPDGEEFYDAEGHVMYDRVALSARFLDGVERLTGGTQQYRVAMMCAEENPTECHRHLLVGRVLAERGVALLHIRGDGRLETNEEVVRRSRGDDGQQFLFEDMKEPPWRSIQSVLPKPPPETSSNG